jgi:hypothetical protein
VVPVPRRDEWSDFALRDFGRQRADRALPLGQLKL